jgi:hypothetical protein
MGDERDGRYDGCLWPGLVGGALALAIGAALVLAPRDDGRPEPVPPAGTAADASDHRAVYADLHEAAMLATYEARHRFPLSRIPDGEARAYLAAHRRAHDAARERLLAPVLRRHGITRRLADLIEAEGDAAGWPAADPPDPFGP